MVQQKDEHPDQQINGPLTGVRVIELAHIMAGPICGLIWCRLTLKVNRQLS